jgi:thiaminase (transcriptional activator TenA)
MTQSWTDQLWATSQDTYAAILDHPFLKGLTSGALEESCFAY